MTDLYHENDVVCIYQHTLDYGIESMSRKTFNNEIVIKFVLNKQCSAPPNQVGGTLYDKKICEPRILSNLIGSIQSSNGRMMVFFLFSSSNKHIHTQTH